MEERPIQIAAVAGFSAAMPSAALPEGGAGDQMRIAAPSMKKGMRTERTLELARLANKMPEAASSE
jgi:hypothetical protein